LWIVFRGGVVLGVNPTAYFKWGESGESLSSSSVAISKNVWTSAQGAGNIAVSKNYDIEVTVKDAFWESHSTATIAFVPIAYPQQGDYFGLVSQLRTQANTKFTTPVTLSVIFNQNVTIDGLHFIFNPFDNSWCNEMSISFVNASNSASTVYLNPTGYDYYYATKRTKIKEINIQFKGMNKQDRFLWLQKLVFGKTTYFSDNEIISHSFQKDMSLASEDLSIGTLNASLLLEDPNRIDVFSMRKNLYSYFKGDLQGVYLLDGFDRSAVNKLSVSCLDVVDNLDKTSFHGFLGTGEYDNGGNVFSVEYALNLLSTLSGLKIDCENSIKSIPLKGNLARCSARYALVQVAFAVAGVIDVLNDGSIYIRKIRNGVTSHFGAERCMQGVKVNFGRDSIKEVVLHYFAYDRPTNFGDQRYGDWSGWEKVTDVSPGVSQLELCLSKPMRRFDVRYDEDLYPNGYPDGLSLEAYANRIIYSCDANLTGLSIWGVPYIVSEMVISKVNAGIGTNDSAIIKEYKDYSLVSNTNAGELLEHLYDMALRKDTVSATVILEDEKLGDMVSIDTDFGLKEGIITHMNVDLQTHKIAQVEIRCK
jgi:hypothetical protein